MLPFSGNFDRNIMLPYWPTVPIDRMFNMGEIKEVVNTSEKYTITLDVSPFLPQDIEVNIIGRELCISGKHEERSDVHGSISRSFTRKYILTDDLDQIRSRISEGKLTVEATKQGSIQPRSIPIIF